MNRDLDSSGEAVRTRRELSVDNDRGDAELEELVFRVNDEAWGDRRKISPGQDA